MYTANNFIASPAFMKVAVNEACEMLACVNNATVDEIKTAYRMGASKVVANINELVQAAAEESARRFNERIEVIPVREVRPGMVLHHRGYTARIERIDGQGRQYMALWLTPLDFDGVDGMHCFDKLPQQETGGPSRLALRADVRLRIVFN